MTRRGRPPQVVPADAGDLDALSQVIAKAFHDLPQSQWLIGDPGARAAVLPAYFRILAGHALAHGVVHTTTDRAAAALWLPAGPGTTGEPDDYPGLLAAVTGRWHERFLAFDATVGQHHPSHRPHEHLAILAVHPSRQNQGIGSALLHARHHQLDHGPASPAYLEAATRRAVRLYQRHGYTLTTPFHLPGDGPPMWPMVRPPAST